MFILMLRTEMGLARRGPCSITVAESGAIRGGTFATARTLSRVFVCLGLTQGAATLSIAEGRFAHTICGNTSELYVV